MYIPETGVKLSSNLFEICVNTNSFGASSQHPSEISKQHFLDYLALSSAI